MKNKKLFAILTLVCFMFTLMPVAAFAAADVQKSYAYVNDAEVDKYEAVSVDIDLDATTDSVYVWFEKTAGVPSTALLGVSATDTDYDSTKTAAQNGYAEDANGVVTIAMNPATDKTVYVAFDTDGTYELHAATVPVVKGSGENWADVMDRVADYELQVQSGYNKVVVSADSVDSDDYVIVMNNVAPATATADDIVKDGKSYEITAVDSNGIAETPVTFTVYESFATKDAAGNTLTGVARFGDVVYASDIKVEGSSKVSVNDLKVKRNGVVSFDVVAEKAGTHKVKVTIGDYEATIKVNANNGEAETIELDYISQSAVDPSYASNGLAGYMRFAVYDANGNELTNGYTLGFDYAQNSTDANYGSPAKDVTGYVSIVEQPAKSKIKNSQLKLEWKTTQNGESGWVITGAKFKEEGDYTFKVALNDGTSAKATITIKEAGDPVALSIAYFADSVQLGATIAPKSVGWLDANNVFTSATIGTDVEFTASGVAVESVDANGKITVKNDEKYVGSEILVTVVDEENNLIITKTLTVAAEAKELVFDTTSVPVDTNRTIGVKLVDEDGKTVGLTDVTTAEAYAIVLAKPADCDVTADVPNNGDLSATDAKKGAFDITFSADAVGTVTIQAVLKTTNNAGVVRYYTGTQTIKVGADGFENVVVMSIGSNSIVVNDGIAAIDASPVVENGRTFVPFRALAEAFGATVAYDEATQAITAELDGVTVVMTVGSATYTVNGEEATMDVAPYITDGRTMVPVRFVAEAFGITVTPTYDENGATADVVFAK